MALAPKPYQQDALDAFRRFLIEARRRGNEAAFSLLRPTHRYRALPGLQDAPSVCLRIPTGGGKTLLAAMAISAAADYLEVEYPLVLWLVPSDSIRTQTLKALQDRDHPYRQALGERFGDRVRVLETSQFTQIRPQDLTTGVCVIVGSIQSLTVNKTELRKVYADNENLDDHFSIADDAREDLERSANAPAKAAHSFANLLKKSRPLVIVDEAHRFMTPLADDVRQRIGPGMVLEITATPKQESNVIYSATAAELKAADMIKLPIVLDVHRGDWQQAVCAAVQKRAQLEQVAVGKTPYVRPLLLLQAQNKGGEADWQAVKNYLVEVEKVPASHIAVHTGDVREIDGVDLFAPTCEIRHIITIQALKEGWDCSFAYVLCSVANIGSAQDVEQLLGRVMRLPYAQLRPEPELNKAYAFISSNEFLKTAETLKDSLIDLGFEKEEAEASLESTNNTLLFDPPFELVVGIAPVMDEHIERESGNVVVHEAGAGQYQVKVYAGKVSSALAEQLLQGVVEAARPGVRQRIEEHNARFAPSFAEQGKAFRVPQLTVEVEGQRELFDAVVLEDSVHVDLMDSPADLSPFRYDERARRFTFDLQGSEISISEGRGEMLSGFATAAHTPVELVARLADQLRDPQIPHDMLTAWIRDGVHRLLDSGSDIAILHQGRYVLRTLLEAGINHAELAARSRAYQNLLFDTGNTALTLADLALDFARIEYQAPSYCKRRFNKHYFRKVGDLKEEGEEMRCAVAIDTDDEVEYWVRNVPRQPGSFSLQTSTNRYYPDFLAKLKSGPVLAIEYKGKHLEDYDVEKRELGELWARQSGGTALFLWAVKQDRQGRDVEEQIRAVTHTRNPNTLR